jgi:hypothetical protein
LDDIDYYGLGSVLVFGKQTVVDEISKFVRSFVGLYGSMRSEEFSVYIKKREK